MRTLVLLIVGNVTILITVAWEGTGEIGVKRLVIATLASIVLFNGTFLISRKMHRSRAKSDESSLISNDSRGWQPGSAILVTISAVGLIVLIAGVVVPSRLPRNQRHLGREAIAAVVGFGLICTAGRLSRKKRT
jgi:hypothetical protein